MHSLPPEGFSTFSHINLNSFAARFSLTLGLVLLLGTRQAHDVNTTSPQRRCNVMTLHRR